MAKSNSFFNIDLLVLSILRNHDHYGYEVVKLMNEISDEAITIKEGTLYPIMYNLLKKGYITSEDKIVNRKIRVYYHIEDTGIEYLENVIKEFKLNIEGVFKIIQYGEKGE
ncbi:PadR family transcriptional regulator [Amedibacillus sp. YH-ame10]